MSTEEKTLINAMLRATGAAAPPKSSHNVKRTRPGVALEDATPAAEVAEIKYHDGPLFLPHGMGIPAAIELLRAREDYLSTSVNIIEDFDVLPYDGANALRAVLSEIYGWANGIPSGFFGMRPPTMVRVQTDIDEWTEVPWGRFSLPGVEGYIETGSKQDSAGRLRAVLSASVMRKDEASMRRLLRAVRDYLKRNSLYRGKAIRMRFRDDDGDLLPHPEPQFFNTSIYSREMLIYSHDVEAAIEANLFTPIERVQDVLANGIPVKRTIMLSGTYGTGKTLAASVAATLAQQNGVTYVYCAKASELPDALAFARQYQSPAAVVFCEDIDRELDGERDADVDEILNIVDGIDSKTTNVITVLTSNNVDTITAAMLRPGRLDCVIDVTPPDAEAVQRLLRAVGNGAIHPDTDLSAVGEALAGHIPAVISEVVKRAKLVQLSKQKRGTPLEYLSAEALLQAAEGMAHQLRLMSDAIERENAEEVPTLDAAFREMVEGAVEDITPGLRELSRTMQNAVKKVLSN